MTASEYKAQLGAELAQALGGQFQYFKNHLALRRDAPIGHDVVSLAGSNKYSPHLSVNFYFGRSFAAVKEVEKRLGLEEGLFHIQQLSVNRIQMAGLEYAGPYKWSVDINQPPPNLVAQIAGAVRVLAEPFFARYPDPQAARDAIANGDSWCFSGKIFWRQVLLFDLALGDLEHFAQWQAVLNDLERRQAEEMMAAYQRA